MNKKIGLSESDLRVIGSPLKSRWSYSDAKALDETATQTYFEKNGLDTVIVRLFNTVGPGQSGRYGMVIPRFVAQAQAGESLRVYGDGTQIRCFCHVLDVVPALVALIDDPRAYGKAFNLGSTEQVAIETLASRTIAALGSSSDIVYVPYAEAHYPGYEDVERRVPDCTRVREQIGFSPTRTLDDIIHDVAGFVPAGISQ
jgi:UDP-glucose 4-epimerase